MRSAAVFVISAAIVLTLLFIATVITLVKRLQSLWSKCFSISYVSAQIATLWKRLFPRGKTEKAPNKLMQHIELARCHQVEFICKLICGCGAMALATILFNISFGIQPRQPEACWWCFVFWVVLSAPFAFKGSLISVNRVDFWYVMVSLVEVSFVSQLHVEIRHLELQSWSLCLPRLFATLPIRRRWLALVMNLLHSGHVWIRLTCEVVPSNGLHGNVNHVIVSELLNFVLMCASSVFLRRMWEAAETLRSEIQVKSIELDTASRFLKGSFDAVIELDCHLTLAEHSPELASMLLKHKGPRDGMSGTAFESLFAAEEQDRVRKHVSSSHQFPITSRMIDSASIPVHVELFHIRYNDFANELRTLVGIKEVAEGPTNASRSHLNGSQNESPRACAPEDGHAQRMFESKRRNHRSHRVSHPNGSRRPRDRRIYFDGTTFEVLGMDEESTRVAPTIKETMCLNDLFEVSDNLGFFTEVQDFYQHVEHSEEAIGDKQFAVKLRSKATSLRGNVTLKKVNVVGIVDLKDAASQPGKRSGRAGASNSQNVSDESGSETSSARSKGTPSRTVKHILGEKMRMQKQVSL